MKIEQTHNAPGCGHSGFLKISFQAEMFILICG